MSENRDTRTIFSASRVTLISRSGHMFLQSALPSSFLSSKPCLFPLESTLEFVIHRGKPKFISLPVKFPPDRSKFQFFSMARSNNNFHANFAAVFAFFSSSNGRNNAKYAFPHTFENNTTQYLKKKTKKRNNKVGTFTTIFEWRY